MKNHILIMLLVCICSFNVQGQRKDSNEKKSINYIIKRLCISLQVSATNGGGNTGDNLERLFLKHLGITKDTLNYKKRIAEFWNKESDNFICAYKILHAKRTPQHLMKRAVDLGLQSHFYFRYLFKFKDPKINFNAVEIYNGKEETIIDYLDNILKTETNNINYDLDSVERLREVLIRRFGTKRARELKK